MRFALTLSEGIKEEFEESSSEVEIETDKTMTCDRFNETPEEVKYSITHSDVNRDCGPDNKFRFNKANDLNYKLKKPKDRHDHFEKQVHVAKNEK